MAENIKIQKNKEQRPPLQKWAITSTVIFFVVGYAIAMPCLCPSGAVKGQFKSIFLLIVMLRLIVGIFKRNLQVKDFLLWTIVFFIFCIIAENL